MRYSCHLRPFAPAALFGVLLTACLYGCSGAGSSSSTNSSAIITTVAGNGTAGGSGDGGAATSAELNQPVCIVLDSSGNIYITDSYNNEVRKVTAATSLISTYAGNGTTGYRGDTGPATSAWLHGVAGCALDTSGNLYIADDANNVIRKITAATGIITTIAGTGFNAGTPSGGFTGDGGLATSAELNHPLGVLVDSSGNIFISDTGNQRVREISASTGIITTIAGNGTYGYSGNGGAAISAMIGNPEQLTLDASGNLYIAEQGASVIARVNLSTHIITTVAGNGTYGTGINPVGDGGLATQAQLAGPSGVALDASGNIYIADSGNNRVREVNASTGIITNFAGSTSGYSGDGHAPASAQLHNPEGLYFDASGNLYIADYFNNTIRKITF